MKRTPVILTIISFILLFGCWARKDAGEWNVLFIIVDDLNDMVGALADAVMLPEHFRNHGYLTAIYGKVFHETDNFWHADLCTPGYYSAHRGFWANIPDTSLVRPTDFRYEGGSNFTWGPIPVDWENDLDDLPECAWYRNGEEQLYDHSRDP